MADNAFPGWGGAPPSRPPAGTAGAPILLSSDSDGDTPDRPRAGGRVVVSDDERDTPAAAPSAASAAKADALAADLASFAVRPPAASSSPATPAGQVVPVPVVAAEAQALPSTDTPPPTATPDAPPLVAGPRGEFLLDGRVTARLYPHQREGVVWLASCLVTGRGGILADEMGLGKTLQVAAAVRGALDSGLARRVLVVAPKTLLGQWAAELAVVGLKSMTHEYLSSVSSERAAALAAVGPPTGAGILLTTYGMVQHNFEVLAGGPAPGTSQQQPSLWDVAFFDEGHKLKNAKTLQARNARALPCRVKVLLTGTPVQNELEELHALLDLAAPGLLGTAANFRDEFARRIARGTDRAASELERAEGAGAAVELRRRIAPAFLRHEKETALKPALSAAGPSADAATTGSEPKPSSAPPALGTKTDLVVWLTLQPTQRELYAAFLRSDAVRAALNKTSSPLAAITILKKICDHPALLTERAAAAAAADAARRGDEEEEEDDDDDDPEFLPGDDGATSTVTAKNARGRATPAEASSPAPPANPDETWLDRAHAAIEARLLAQIQERGADASAKTAFAPALVARLVAAGHRCLLFSQSRVMLDILQADLHTGRGLTVARIDGTMASASDRAATVAAFQRPDGAQVLLLSTGVGGLGLTLTSATRVILVDPSWNPAADSQAVDRAYRIGQTQDVVVYRLISAGTVEEKIYRKQVFKEGLSRAPLKPGQAFRYFSQDQLTDLFSLDESAMARSATADALEAAHPGATNAAARASWGELIGLPGVVGVSDHGLLYSRDGEGRVARHVPPAPPAPKPPPGTATGRGRGQGASSSSTGAWPPWPAGATPKPPQRPAWAAAAGRGRGRGSGSSARGRRGGGSTGRGRGRRPQRAEDVIVDAAANVLGGLLGRAFRWGARVLSPKNEAQASAPPPPRSDGG